MNNIDVVRLLIIIILIYLSYYKIKNDNGIIINIINLIYIILILSIIIIAALGLTPKAIVIFLVAINVFIDSYFHFINGIKYSRYNPESRYLSLKSFIIGSIISIFFIFIYLKYNQII